MNEPKYVFPFISHRIFNRKTKRYRSRIYLHRESVIKATNKLGDNYYFNSFLEEVPIDKLEETKKKGFLLFAKNARKAR